LAGIHALAGVTGGGDWQEEIAAGPALTDADGFRAIQSTDRMILSYDRTDS
jgi:hypothetical protein